MTSIQCCEVIIKFQEHSENRDFIPGKGNVDILEFMDIDVPYKYTVQMKYDINMI